MANELSLPLNLIVTLIVKVLLSRNAKVYIACRSRDKAEAAIAELEQVTAKSEIHFIELDLSSFESIKQAAEVLKRCEEAHCIIISS